MEGCSFYLLLAVSLSLLLCHKTRARTPFVLKNGRRIVALSVARGRRQSALPDLGGELALPKSIVDHIEKGGAGQMPASPSAGAANLAITPPQHRRLWRECRGGKRRGARWSRGSRFPGCNGQRSALERSQGKSHKRALAYHAVAQFELSRGEHGARAPT